MNMCMYSNVHHALRADAELLIYYPAMISIKASICLLYMRLFASVRYIRIASWIILVAFVTTATTSFILICIKDAQTRWDDSDEIVSWSAYNGKVVSSNAISKGPWCPAQGHDVIPNLLLG